MKYQFKCPECGDTRLDSIELMTESYRVTSIEDDESITCHKVETSDKCDLLDSGRDHFQCSGCGFVPKYKDGVVISDDFDIVEWIKKNC